MSQKDSHEPSASTLAALLKDKPKRGRPPHVVSRQNVYVSLSESEKEKLKQLAKQLPTGIKRADIPDLAISVLAARIEALRQAVSGRDRELPEGITDLPALYLLWDLPLPATAVSRKWTSVRLSPQPSLELGRAHGMLNAAFNANRSETFSLAIALLEQFIETQLPDLDLRKVTVAELRQRIMAFYL